MRLIFAGTPEFAAQALDAIIAAGHEVALVLTQPDRPSGRGMALRASPVKERALAAGIEVFQPPTLRDAAAQEQIRAVGAEAMIVAERHEHIFLETSSTQLLEVQMAYKRVGPEKIVMGTDWPGSVFALERAKIARAIPDAADRALVEGENLARILRLAR